MSDYDSYPEARMTREQLAQLDDHSMCVGIKTEGDRFRADFGFFSGNPRWVVGEVYVDEECKQKIQRLERHGSPAMVHSSLLCSPPWLRTRYWRVVFVDAKGRPERGPQPRHTLREQLAQLARFDALKRLVGGVSPAATATVMRWLGESSLLMSLMSSLVLQFS